MSSALVLCLLLGLRSGTSHVRDLLLDEFEGLRLVPLFHRGTFRAVCLVLKHLYLK